MRRRDATTLACGAVIATAGCFPMLAHPTRVQEGVSLAVVDGAHVMTDSAPATGDLDLNLRPNFTVLLAVGGRRPDDSEGPAYRLAPTIGVTNAAPGHKRQIFVTAIIGGLPAMDVRKCFIRCLEDTEVVKRTSVMIGLNAARGIRRLPRSGPARRDRR